MIHSYPQAYEWFVRINVNATKTVMPISQINSAIAATVSLSVCRPSTVSSIGGTALNLHEMVS